MAYWGSQINLSLLPKAVPTRERAAGVLREGLAGVRGRHAKPVSERAWSADRSVSHGPKGQEAGKRSCRWFSRTSWLDAMLKPLPKAMTWYHGRAAKKAKKPQVLSGVGFRPPGQSGAAPAGSKCPARAERDAFGYRQIVQIEMPEGIPPETFSGMSEAKPGATSMREGMRARMC